MNNQFISTVWLQITSICNLECKYCYSFKTGRKEGLNYRQVEEVLSALAARGSCMVIFSGGEPSMDPLLPAYLKLAAEDYGHSTGIVTNAVQISGELLEALRNYEVNIQVSLDTLNPETYYKICGRDKLESVLRNISGMLNYGLEPCLSFTVTSHNVDEVTGIAEYALLNGITHIHIGLMVSSGRGSCFRTMGDVRLYELWQLLYPVQRQYYQSLAIDLIEDFLFPVATEIKRNHYCAAMAGRALEVLSSGRVTACGMVPDSSFLYGDLKDEDFEVILRRLENGDSRICFDAARLENCRECHIRNICGSGCRALAYIANGDFYGPHPFCEDLKKIYTFVRQEIARGELDSYFRYLNSFPKDEHTSSRYY